MMLTTATKLPSNGKQAPETSLSTFARDVRAGLTRPGQKELPSKYLYDDLGSALFEAITYLPEYGVTRADSRVISRLSAELASYFPARTTVAELGSGSGKKTRVLLQAFSNGHKPLYLPIDVSLAALEKCRLDLEDTAEVVGFHDTYLEGLRRAESRRIPGKPVLLLFLGSNIGNFDRRQAEDFLIEVRRSLRKGDGLLIGTDLEKPVQALIEGYDDPAGVTAAFNLNLLGRINRELGADFDLRRFRHEARYDRALRRVEMHLRSLSDQVVTIPAADIVCRLRAGETIWTEASHKYCLDELPQIAERCGFYCAKSWVDEEWPFAESLWVC